MSALRILGAGQVSACGAGLESLGERLENPCVEVQRASIHRTGDEPLVPYLKADPQGLDDCVPPRAVRRLDDFSKNFIYSARQALDGIDRDSVAPERIAVVSGTSTGSIVTSFSLLDDIILTADDAVSPFKFTTSVNNASATSVATFHGARGSCLSVLGFQDILLNVLRIAGAWLEEERADVVIAAAGDEFHPMIGYGLHHLGGWAEDGRIRPFDFEACSFVPGETFAALALGRADGAGGRATIDEVRHIVDLDTWQPPDGRAVVLAADGRSTCNPVYRRLAERLPNARAYSALWGGNRAVAAMDVLVAVLGVEHGRLCAMPEPHGAPGGHATGVVQLVEPVVDCVAANPDNSGSVITVSR